MKHLNLSGKRRHETGRGSARKQRKKGWIPGIIYGDSGNLPISFAVKDLHAILHSVSGGAAIVSIAVDGETERSAIMAEYQRDPLSGALLHVDFHEISHTKKMLLHIPIRITGLAECVGVREDGGVFECMTHSVAVRCIAKDMPSECVVDVSSLRLGHAIHVKDLPPMERVEYADPSDQVIASCAAVTEEAESEEAEESSEAATAATTDVPAGKSG
ncbi:MAG: 50S ribosomal protein L25 [Puniceicoccales bacterium]|jgi:large subunit ribosomal protein L25|nr:50S ribosomal protein L25 [Puniceicoccales bacterium]